MANQYDTNLKLQAIADAIGDSSSSGLIQALEDIADAVAGGGGGGSSTAGLVSDNFSETDTYDLGDYCIHNNTLYVCINAITTPGAWDLSDWQATNAGIQLSSLNSAISTLNSSTTTECYAVTNVITVNTNITGGVFGTAISLGNLRILIGNLTTQANCTITTSTPFFTVNSDFGRPATTIYVSSNIGSTGTAESFPMYSLVRTNGEFVQSHFASKTLTTMYFVSFVIVYSV